MKKLLGKIVFTVLVLGFTTSNVCAREFSDLSADHWAQKEINILAKDNVVVGYPDETFKPDQPVTKAEFVTMVIKALWQENYEHEQLYYYKDVPNDYWAYEMIQIASDFDLLKGYPDGLFKPDENLKKGEAVKIVISSVEAGEEVIDKVVANPPEESCFNPDKLISRAEMAVMLYNMRKQALLRPNKKLAQVFTPKTAHGIRLKEAEMEDNGFIAFIPAGTVIQGILADDIVNSQIVDLNSVCVVKTTDNYVTQQNYLLFPAGTNIAGAIVDVEKAKYFIRNAKMDINGKRVIIESGESAEIDAAMTWDTKKSNWFMRMVRAVIKGRKIILNEGDVIYVKLTKSVRVDTAKTMILSP